MEKKSVAMTQWLTGLVLAGFLTGAAGCSSDSAAPTASDVAAAATANISGYITATLGGGSSSSKHSAAAKLGLGGGGAVATADACQSGTYVGAYVGGGGTQVVSGSFTASEFTVPDVEQKKELILTFTCSDSSTIRCMVKSGDAGVYCDPVADAVVGAFETALGKTIYDSAFFGKSIAKIGASIVQAAQNESTATEAFNAQIAACQSATDKPSCYEDAIKASPFNGAFKMMQTIVNGWTVEAIFTLLADMFGAQIGVDDFIYSLFADVMDSSFSTDFTSSTRAFLASVVADQIAGGNTYVVKVECLAHISKYRAGGQIRYSPVMATINGFSQPSCKNDTALTTNGLSSGQLATYYAAIDSGGSGGGWNVNLANPSDTSGSQCNNAWQNPGAFCLSKPELQIVSKFKEPNRNDPSGSYSSYDRLPQLRFTMITAFPELETAVMGALAAAPAGCFSMGSGGGPSIADTPTCRSWLTGILNGQKKNVAGLMGLYMYLKNPADYGVGEEALLSLEQIHKIFVGEDFMNGRLASWAPGYNGRNAGNSWMSPLLAYSGGIFTMQDIFKWDSSAWSTAPNDAAKEALLLTAYNASSVPYANTFEMFEHIPSQEEIRSFVFGSAHHEGWNPTGGKFFYAAGKDSGGVKPIFCKMTDKDSGAAMETELTSKSMISCQLGSAVVDDEGQTTMLSGYPYVLQERGWEGDSVGRTYALADRKTGMTVRPGEKELLILQKHNGNSGGCNASGGANTVINKKVKYGWGDDTKEEAVNVFCMDMSALTTSNSLSFYWGGMIEVSQSDSSGNTWKWSVPQVGRFLSGSSDYTILPVCYFAPSGHFATDAQTGVVSAGSGGGAPTISGTGEITNVGSASVDLCENSSSYASATQYAVVMMGSWATSKSDLKAYLMGSGSSAGSAILQWQTWSPSVTQWDELNVSLKASTLETALAAAGMSNPKVAPDSPPTFTLGVKMANQRYNAKFDPFCDDVNDNGGCDCKIAGTSTLKSDPSQCTLEDDAAEPTISNPPYWPESPNAAAMQAFFSACGGKGGADLQTCVSGGVDGSYLQSNQIWMDYSEAFACQYKVTGETNYRKPKYQRWDGFWKNHDGCPKSDGSLVALNMGSESTTGGPVRLINPEKMRNAYDVDRPNTLIKLINFATKSVGQGVTISKTDRVFGFDEAMALVALRTRIPAEVEVYNPGTTTANSSARRHDVFPYFEFVRTPGNDHGNNDVASGVLRGLTRPAELQ